MYALATTFNMHAHSDLYTHTWSVPHSQSNIVISVLPVHAHYYFKIKDTLCTRMLHFAAHSFAHYIVHYRSPDSNQSSSMQAQQQYQSIR
jgi:hypothetical protein